MPDLVYNNKKAESRGKKMRNIEMKFLDEYKRVDNICADMYSCKNGISAYLAQMDDTPDEDRFLVPSWDDDYKALTNILLQQ